MPSYLPPTFNAVNFNDTNGAYSVPAFNAVNFNDIHGFVNSAGIGSAEAVGTPAIVAVAGLAGIATTEGVGSPALNAAISSLGVASLEAFGLPQVGDAVAPPVVDSGAGGATGPFVTYGLVHQRTNVYVDRSRVTRISGLPEQENMDEQDRLDMLDIFTTFSNKRKAA
jgi:hypothetical protein